jgi:hypothetical protein
MTDAFDGAELYGCFDSEDRAHSDPWEAIEAHLDHWMSPGCDVAAIIVEQSPVTVTAYMRARLPDSWTKRTATWLVERAVESFEEEYSGDCDCDFLIDIPRDDVHAEIFAALKKFYAQADVWLTEEVAKREYSTAEVMALARANRSDWFEAT